VVRVGDYVLSLLYNNRLPHPHPYHVPLAVNSVYSPLLLRWPGLGLSVPTFFPSRKDISLDSSSRQPDTLAVTRHSSLNHSPHSRFTTSYTSSQDKISCKLPPPHGTLAIDPTNESCYSYRPFCISPSSFYHLYRLLNMAKKTSRASKQNNSDVWVMVNPKVSTQTNTSSRTPQYNRDNEPSGQMANASTSPSPYNSIVFEEVENAGPDGYPVVNQRTQSNGSSDGTATSGAATLTYLPSTTRPQYGVPTRAYHQAQTLTESSLQRYQEELAHQAVVNVPGWITDSPGYRLFAQHPAPSTHGSMMAGRSMPITTGSTRHGQYASSAFVGIGDVVVAAGAWSDDHINAFIAWSSSPPRFDSE